MADAGARRHSEVMSSTTRIKIGPVPPAVAAHVEKTVEAVPRVRAVTLDPAGEEIVVEHDAAPLSEIVAALHAVGFDSRVVSET
jgi:hypothetical protein